MNDPPHLKLAVISILFVLLEVCLEVFISNDMFLFIFQELINELEDVSSKLSSVEDCNIYLNSKFCILNLYFNGFLYCWFSGSPVYFLLHLSCI